MAYYEIWIDKKKEEKALKHLKKFAKELHSVFWDYNYIVELDPENEEDVKKIDGIKRIRRHYGC
jgi:DNA-binding Lrp family transcriptional regulator